MVVSYQVRDLQKKVPGRVDRNVSLPIEPDCLNVLAQPRTRMDQDSLKDLAEGILARGQLNAGRVVALESKLARRYVSEINRFWDKKHDFKKLKSCRLDGKLYYLFVIYGHRRLAACKLAMKMDSERFPGTYLCDIYYDLTLEEVFPLQIMENTHEPISKLDELDALLRGFRYYNQDGTLTVSAYARMVGRSPDAIREMLLFSSLPVRLQNMMDPKSKSGKVSYTVLVELARLARVHEECGQKLSEEVLIGMAMQVIVSRQSTASFSEEVRRRIDELRSGQGDMFGLITPTRRHIRKVAAGEVVGAVHQGLGYLHTIRDLDEAGLFGDEDVPGQYSVESPAGLIPKLVEAAIGVAGSLAPKTRRHRRDLKRLINK